MTAYLTVNSYLIPLGPTCSFRRRCAFIDSFRAVDLPRDGLEFSGCFCEPGRQLKNILKQHTANLLIGSGRLHAQGGIPMSLFIRAARRPNLFHHASRAIERRKVSLKKYRCSN